MGRLSRGCLRCRQRRVRCDEGRPSCRRCLDRDELCEGYRDESTLIFRHETHKVIELARAAQLASPPNSHDSSQSPRSLASRRRSKSVGAGPRLTGPEASALAPKAAPAGRLLVTSRRPWLKEVPPAHLRPPPEEEAVDQFLERYVVYPCNQSSSPGFLEHLPSMFKEVNVEGRNALRWAVQAAAYADLSRDQDSDALASRALQCYGMALQALGESLATPGKVPDDYDLMTVVVLDIFEVRLQSGSE